MIFYFSGTGNTRWAAQRLSEATGERLRFIPDELQREECKYELAPDERLGLCFPVHGWQPPAIVRRFISRMKITLPSETAVPSSETKRGALPYTYLLCTYGDSAGLAMKMTTDLLREKGLDVASYVGLTMPESYVCLPFMYTDKPERERQKIAKAATALDEFVKVIVKRRQGYFQLVEGMAPWLMSHVIGQYFNRRMVSDRKFTVDADVCLHCGRCVQECPVGDVVLTEGLPTWKHDGSCTNCLSCYHHCPVHAINYGNITRRRGQYYFRTTSAHVE